MIISGGFRQRRFFAWFSVVALLLLLCGFASAEPKHTVLTFFWEKGCPVCARAKPFIAELEVRYPSLEVKSFEVAERRENFELLSAMSKAHGQELQGVPTFFIGGSMFVGFSPEIGRGIEKEVRRCLGHGCPERAGAGTVFPAGRGTIINVPLLGQIDFASHSLPLFTLVVAGLDGFNPCSFFVLFFLLSLLIHAHSRFRLALVGSVFVSSSALVYFLYMAAWLKLFTFVGRSSAISSVAGALALFMAAINIKDFFFFRKGISLAIPEKAKPRLLERMRGLLRVSSPPAMVAGTVLLAVAANSYGLLCTVGFPMIFIRVLTLHALPGTTNYLYLALYNLVHIVPLAVFVIVFTITFRSRKLAEREGRILKLVSGVMMLFLGLILLVSPYLLNSAAASLAVLVATLGITWTIVFLVEKHAATGER